MTSKLLQVNIKIYFGKNWQKPVSAGPAQTGLPPSTETRKSCYYYYYYYYYRRAHHSEGVLYKTTNHWVTMLHVGMHS